MNHQHNLEGPTGDTIKWQGACHSCLVATHTMVSNDGDARNAVKEITGGCLNCRATDSVILKMVEVNGRKV